jgi:hypothetical protein
LAAIGAGVGGYLLGRFGLELPAQDLWSPNTLGLSASAVAYTLSTLVFARNRTAK